METCLVNNGASQVISTISIRFFSTKLTTLCAAVAISIFLLQNAAAEERLIRLGTTHTTDSSGLIQQLISAFERDTNYKVSTYVSGTGNVLRRARTGQLDVVIVHAPEAEKKFLSEKYGVDDHGLMNNTFLLVGPANDVGGVSKANNILAAFKDIAAKELLFVSRGDDSGTNKKELTVWKSAGVDPYGEWYVETGTNMADSLKIADIKQAYTLTDIATWLTLHKTLNLGVIFQGDSILDNPYSVILVNPARYSTVNYKGAKKLRDWLLSPKAQDMIASFQIEGKQVFLPYRK